MEYRICLIAAIGERSRVIGRRDDLPWSRPLTPDMERFVSLTMGSPVIMGSKTWNSIPQKYRPLKGRENIVITRELDAQFPGAYVSHSVRGALESAEKFSGGDIFVMGGAQIYQHSIRYADRLYLTLVDEDPEGDTLFPEYSEFTNVIERVVVDFSTRLTFLTLERP